MNKKSFLNNQKVFFDDLITKHWDTYTSSDWDKTRIYEVSQILDHVESPKKVLDLGCGCGFHDVEFAKSIKVNKVLGVDFSERSIRKANKEYRHQKVERRSADFITNKNRFGKFDLVVSFQVIEHLKNPEDYFNACLSFVKNNGYVALVTPNKDRLQNRFNQIFGISPEMVDELHFREYSIGDLTNIANKFNLKLAYVFGRNSHLNILGFPIINSSHKLSMNLGIKAPEIADFIGVIFKYEQK